MTFLVDRMIPISFGIRWSCVLDWCFTLIIFLPIGFGLAIFLRSQSLTRWALCFGLCYGVFEFLMERIHFSPTASISDQAWTYSTYAIPSVTCYVSVKIWQQIQKKQNVLAA
jgi:hypothetical protein